jgi:hypothetical protein
VRTTSTCGAPGGALPFPSSGSFFPLSFPSGCRGLRRGARAQHVHRGLVGGQHLHTAKVHAITGQTHATYNTRQAAHDLRKLRGKQLISKPGRTRRYYLPGPAARTISALLTLRDHVIAPILAGVQIRRHDHVPTRLTPIDQDYEHLRTDMVTLFSHLGIQPGPAAA